MIRTCNKCGFILGTRPGLKEKDGVCQACINLEKAKNFDWAKRENDLKVICEDLKAKKQKYDCIVAVSGGKDSTVIVSTLVEKYGLKPLLVTVTDEFTHTKAGTHNINNISERFNLDHIVFRHEPKTFKAMTKKDTLEQFWPLKWVEEKIYETPVMIAEKFGIDTIFFGENSDFQYGAGDDLYYLHKNSTDKLKIYFFFAFYPYSELSNRENAKKYGYKDLDDYGEWDRQGNIENYTQQDSVGYLSQLWAKFIKFGFQRVSDMACRYVRSGDLTKEQAEMLIKEKDYIFDPKCKRDFLRCIDMNEAEFNGLVDKFANKDLLVKDINGNWRRKDLI
jgi:hypothetical protein